MSRLSNLVQRRGRTVTAVVASILAACVLAAGSTDASAATPAAPAWQVTTAGIPTLLQPALGTQGHYQIAVENIGAAASAGEVVVRDRVPAGLTVIQGADAEPDGECSASVHELVCSYQAPVVQAGFVVLEVFYDVSGPIGDLTNTVQVSGGSAPTITATNSTHVAEHEHENGPGGVARFSFAATGPAGEVATQAGGHPSLQTARVLFNNALRETPEEHVPVPAEYVKDTVLYLPLGVLGDALVADYCPPGVVESQPELSGCQPASRVGTIAPFVRGVLFAHTPDPTSEHGVFNIAPEKGYAAEFAFATNTFTFFVYASVVRHDGVYMLRVATPGIEEEADLLGFVASFYGDLTEHFSDGFKEVSFDRGAFLTDPSDCAEGQEAREASVAVNTWETPQVTHTASFDSFPALEGCNLLALSSTLSSGPDGSVSGDTTQADEPSGYRMDVKVPQAPNSGSGLATPPLRSAQFTLPAGTSLNPGAANGLTACPATGPHGIDIPQEGDTLASGAAIPGEPAGEGEAIGADGLPSPVAGHCAASSQVATVKATSPLLGESLSGHLYLAEPGCGNAAHPNPCEPQDASDGNLYRLYMELEAPERGVIVKLPGKALVDPDTGQIKAVFEEAPQFPVSDVVIETTPGPRAALANPQSCATATTTGLINSWSPQTPAAASSSSFQVDSDGAGDGCPATMPFAPTLAAGTANPTAGDYSPFSLVLKREDREQDVSTLTTTLPEGMLAAISHVTQCPEPQAAQGAGCPASSHVGTTTVAIGSGTAPFYQTGQVYLTGPYGGAPFGLTAVVPAVAGPFNLGNVVVRVALHVNKDSGQVSAVSRPLPQIIDGVPLRIRAITVDLNAPRFTFNPTSCAPMSIAARVTATQGASAILSAPFQATDCKKLPFKPTLTASTKAKGSRPDGASLTVKITSAAGQANIGKVDLTIPSAIPSRQSTLKQACTEAQFNRDPAGCPEASNIGVAKALTPLLNAPLMGPAYLVSHGGAAFPDVVFVLQGEGVRIDIDGKTNIKNGITSSRFETVPDAPISSFETVLPTGPHSILGVDPTRIKNYDFCASNLRIPTVITAQDGAVLKQTTKLAVAGCSAKIALAKARAAGSGLLVTFSTTHAGRATFSGAGIRRLTRPFAAGSHSLRLALLGRPGRSARAGARSLTLQATLTVGRHTTHTTTRVKL